MSSMLDGISIHLGRRAPSIHHARPPGIVVDIGGRNARSSRSRGLARAGTLVADLVASIERVHE